MRVRPPTLSSCNRFINHLQLLLLLAVFWCGFETIHTTQGGIPMHWLLSFLLASKAVVKVCLDPLSKLTDYTGLMADKNRNEVELLPMKPSAYITSWVGCIEVSQSPTCSHWSFHCSIFVGTRNWDIKTSGASRFTLERRSYMVTYFRGFNQKYFLNVVYFVCEADNRTEQLRVPAIIEQL